MTCAERRTRRFDATGGVICSAAQLYPNTLTPGARPNDRNTLANSSDILGAWPKVAPRQGGSGAHVLQLQKNLPLPRVAARALRRVLQVAKCCLSPTKARAKGATTFAGPHGLARSRNAAHNAMHQTTDATV